MNKKRLGKKYGKRNRKRNGKRNRKLLGKIIGKIFCLMIFISLYLYLCKYKESYDKYYLEKNLKIINDRNNKILALYHKNSEIKYEKSSRKYWENRYARGGNSGQVHIII